MHPTESVFVVCVYVASRLTTLYWITNERLIRRIGLQGRMLLRRGLCFFLLLTFLCIFKFLNCPWVSSELSRSIVQ